MFELFPLSFGEFLAFNGVSYRPRAGFADMAFDRFEYERLKGYYEEYLAYGGLPEVALAPDAETKTEILNDVLSSYINFDIRVLADFQKIAELQQLLRVLASRIGNKLDHAKLASIVGISRPTLVQYLEFLEMTYVIRRLPAYSGSADRTAALGRKLYFAVTRSISSWAALPGRGTQPWRSRRTPCRPICTGCPDRRQAWPCPKHTWSAGSRPQDSPISCGVG